MKNTRLLACSTFLLAGLLICIAAAALLAVFPTRVLKTVGDFLVVQDELRRADLIHVSAGPGGDRDHRARYAIDLYHQGLGEKVFFTGGRCVAQASLEEQRCAALAEREGIPKGDILVDEAGVESTYAEAVRLKAYLESAPAPVRSVIVVSDPHHTRRARWTYRRVLGDEVTLRMAPVPFEQVPYRRDWWRDEASRAFVVNEYLKFFYYLLVYGVVDQTD